MSNDLLVKILALAFPIVLFIFKYILPSIAEAAYKKTTREKEQVKIELIHFPVDLLFVAIGYTIPQIIDITSKMSSVVMEKSSDIATYQELLSSFVINFGLSIFILLLIPFYVFGTKLAEKYYFSKNLKLLFVILLPSYVISIFLIGFSIFN